jgi:hypothetical protein
VIIDIKIKQRFNTINLTAATTKKYPGDAGMAYVQALKCAAQAFKVDSRISYFVVVTDMENIIFWKIEPTDTKSLKAYSVLFPFGGKYNGRVLQSQAHQVQKNGLLPFRVTKCPRGFSIFVR